MSIAPLLDDVFFTRESVRCELHAADNAAFLKTMPASSVHLVVTSPPYDDLRTYDGYSWDFASLVPELFRVIVPGGIVVWIINDEKKKGSESGSSFRQALFFMEQGFRLHDTMIWQKPNFSHPSSNSYHQVFEYMFVFSKGRPRCFNPIKDRRNIYAGARPLGKNTVSNRDGTKGLRPVNTISEFGQRHNVWLMNTTGQERPCAGIAHPATFPKQLAADHISTWSNPGEVVLDPFVGSGTTCLAAKELGRHSIGIDVSRDYIGMARERCGLS